MRKIWATKLEGGGGKALVAGPLKKYSFFAASLIRHYIRFCERYIAIKIEEEKCKYKNLSNLSLSYNWGKYTSYS